jgi:uncharacterized protein
MKVVLDTNVLVSALLFRGRLARFVELWKEGVITPTISRETYGEFRTVLEYPKFRLTPYEIDTLLQEEILPYFHVVEVRHDVVPVCRDSADDIFLAVARTAAAGWLITGDQDLLVLDPHEEIRIVSPQDFLANLPSIQE